MDNEILQVIKKRRSIRKYKNTQVSKDDLTLILEAATYAPSGSNNQTWLFTAIQNEEILKELNETVRKSLLNLKLTENDYPGKISAQKNAKNPDFNFYYHAPTLIVASNVPNYGNAMADCAAALQNIFLASASLGLGSCWINQLRWLDDDPDVRACLARLVQIPVERTICGSAAIGSMDGILPKAPARKAGTIKIIS